MITCKNWVPFVFFFFCPNEMTWNYIFVHLVAWFDPLRNGFWLLMIERRKKQKKTKKKKKVFLGSYAFLLVVILWDYRDSLVDYMHHFKSYLVFFLSTFYLKTETLFFWKQKQFLSHFHFAMPPNQVKRLKCDWWLLSWKADELMWKKMSRSMQPY